MRMDDHLKRWLLVLAGMTGVFLASWAYVEFWVRPAIAP